MEVATALDNSGSTKRRKVGNGELRLPSSKPVRITEFTGRDSDDVINTSKKLSDSVEKEDLTSGVYVDETSSISGDIPASCCSIDADLEESSETETTTTVRCNLARRESSPLTQIKPHSLSPMAGCFNFTTPTTESGQKPPVLTNSRRTVPPEKTPPAAELEEFFAAAEKDLHNRFKDKYNYDVVNDVPLNGRFEWIQLKP